MVSRVNVGDTVAFSDLPVAIWFVVLKKSGDRIVIRKVDTDEPTRNHFASLVKQVK